MVLVDHEHNVVASNIILACRWRDEPSKAEVPIALFREGKTIGTLFVSAEWIGDTEKFMGYRNVKKHEVVDGEGHVIGHEKTH